MRILALGVGERRVGIAVSDPTRTVARPLRTLVRGRREEDFAALSGLATEYEVELIVVGMPYSLDGTEGPQAKRIGTFMRGLSACLSVKMVSWDERYSSAVASDILRQNRKHSNRQGNRGEVDAVAAAVILQSYLDST